MPFYGQEDVSAPPTKQGRPLRTFRYTTWGGHAKVVEAQFIEFKADHVAFWCEGPDSDFQGTLVVAESNRNVNELREVLA